MNSSRSRTTSNQTTNQTATTTPNVPGFIQQGQQNYFGQVDNLANSGQPFVAGPSQLQQQAFRGAANLGQPSFSWQGGGQPQTQPMAPGAPTQAKADPNGPQVNGGPGDGFTAPQTQPQQGSMGGQGGGMGGGSVYDLAGLLGFNAGTAGANTTDGTALARAMGYGAAGQAQTTGYQGQGYDPAAQGTAQGFTAQGPAAANSYQASGPAQVGGFDAAQASGQGYTAQGFDPAMGTAQGYQGQGFNASGPAGGQGYSATTGQAQGYQGQGYDAQTGQAQTYNPFTGSASGYQASLLDPSMLQMDRAQLGPLGSASASMFSEAGLNERLNPYLSQVQDAFTADFDANAGRTRAAQASQAAMNGGARNSNNAIRDAVTEGELSRARGSGVANIRSDGFNAAAQILGQDNDRATQASIANANTQTQGALAQFGADNSRNQLLTQLGFQGALSNQGAANDAGRFNAGAQNDFGMANLGFLNQAGQFNAQAGNQFGLANMDAANQASQFGANAANQANQFSAGAQNQQGLANQDAFNTASQFGAAAQNQSGLDFAGRTDAAGQFGANAANAANAFSAQAQNQQGLANQDARNAAAQFGAASNNQANQFNSGLQADLSRFNAGAQNDALSQLFGARNASALDFAGRADQAGQFGADAANRSALDFAGRADQAGQFGASEANRFALDFAGRQDQAGQFGANAANQANQFGADALNRSSLDAVGRRDQASQFGADAFNRNSQFNAGSVNQNNQFNAGQQDNALARQLQAAGLLGNLGQAMSSDQRANIALQGDLGAQQRDINQREMTGEYQRLALLQSLYGVNPNALFGQTSNSSGTSNGTNTTTQTPSLLTSIGQGASTISGLASLFSDRRLKADIKPAGTDAKGRKWYDYRYLWDKPGTVHRGVMAQEILASDPDAVATHPSGFLMVDYAKLGAFA